MRLVISIQPPDFIFGAHEAKYPQTSANPALAVLSVAYTGRGRSLSCCGVYVLGAPCVGERALSRRTGPFGISL
jgi:hypothetical protein